MGLRLRARWLVAGVASVAFCGLGASGLAATPAPGRIHIAAGVPGRFHPAAAAPGRIHVLSFSSIAKPNGLHPSYSVPAPVAGDVLVAGNNFTSGNIVDAVVAATGKLDPHVGSNGVLPLPGGYPTGGDVAGITVANNTIYGAFFSSQKIYLVSWNSHGRLNAAFGSGGLVTIPPPSPSQAFLGTIRLAIAGGRLIVGTVATPGETALTPVDPTTGSLGATVVEPQLGSGYVNALEAMQLGPDGNLYALGFGSAAIGGSQVYYGIFDPSTLAPAGQTAFVDGAAPFGEAVAFLGQTAYLGVSSNAGSTTSAALWSAPLGSTSTSGPTTIPSQVHGASQSLAGLNAGPSGLLYATVIDETRNSGGSYAVETDGHSFGPGVLLGPNTFATSASADPGDDEVAGYEATVSNGQTSYGGAFVSTAGPGGSSCKPLIKVLKTVQSYTNPREVKELPPGSGSYKVAVDFQRHQLGSAKIVFVLYVANESNCDATNVTMTDNMFWFHFKSGQVVSGPPANVTEPSGNGRLLTIKIPSLPAHTTLVYEAVAGLGSFARSDNTAKVTGGRQSTVFVDPVDEPVVTNIHPAAGGIQGTAGDGSPIHQIWVAIQSVIASASSTAAPRCSWLSSLHATFRTLPCTRVIWLHATDSKHWKLRFRRHLPSGTYRVFAMALGKHGLSADSFGRHAGDTRVFQVR